MALHHVAVTAAAMVAVVPLAWAAPEWLLMSRHGDCVSLAEATRHEAVFNGVSTPDDLADAVRRQGEAVAVKETRAGDVTVVEVTAPGLGLAVIFVPGDSCSQ